MLGYGDTELAAFIFHELAHQAVYAPGDSDFNEAFATVVETEGLRRWFAHEKRVRTRSRSSSPLRKTPAGGRRADGGRAARLAALYNSDARCRTAMREPRPPNSRACATTLAAGGHPASGDFNNARLIAVATYERCVPALRAELDRLGNDLPAFYAAMKLLVNDPTARTKLCPPP